MFNIITVNGKEYKLRMTLRGFVELENKFKRNPINSLMAMQENEFPPVTDIIAILWGMLIKYNKINYADTIDLFDNYLEEGHEIKDLVNVIVDTLKMSGYIKTEEETEEEAAEKN